MSRTKGFLMCLMSIMVLWGTVGMVVPLESQALDKDKKDGFQFKNVLKKSFPPCGPGTRG